MVSPLRVEVGGVADGDELCAKERGTGSPSGAVPAGCLHRNACREIRERPTSRPGRLAEENEHPTSHPTQPHPPAPLRTSASPLLPAPGQWLEQPAHCSGERAGSGSPAQPHALSPPAGPTSSGGEAKAAVASRPSPWLPGL